MGKYLQELVKDMNEMVSHGQLVEAAEKYFAPTVRTIEYDGSVTEGKQAATMKLNEFVGSIQRVNKLSFFGLSQTILPLFQSTFSLST